VSPRVIVLTDERSTTVAGVLSAVSKLGAQAQLVSTKALPLAGLVAFDFETRVLRINDFETGIDDCSGVWLWHADRPQAIDSEPAAARYVRREWELTISALAALTPKQIWINHPSRTDWLES